jgi:hypothetical protein
MNTRTTRIAALATALAIVATAGVGLGYRWLTASQPVTQASAVQSYRAEQSGVPAATPQPTSAPRATPARGSSGRPSVKSPASAAPAASNPLSWFHAPAAGVYTYDTTGYERATFSRNYPSETQRIIDTSDGRYDNHHVFSQEHEEWFSLHATPSGGEMLKRRIRVTFGPVTIDRTVVFDPGLKGVPYPYRVGDTWSGSWSGDPSGTYTGKTVGQRTVKVGGSDVAVWVEEVTAHITGSISGTVFTRLWWAPSLGLDAREDGIYDMRESGVPGTYHTQYTVTLRSATPSR